MLFSTFGFIFGFLPVCLIGFAFASRLGRRVAGVWLVLASFVFYGWWDPSAVLVLLTSISLNYAAANAIIVSEKKPRIQGLITAGAVVGNLGALIYYKYLFSIVSYVMSYFSAHSILQPVTLPLGISFFSFTQIAYIVDCRAGITRDRSMLNYFLFVTFFPHLIAGPILHHREIMPQFGDPGTYRLSTRNICIGLTIFAIGLAKKCVLADPLADWVAVGYRHTDGVAWAAAWSAALSYSLQLYFDFSGYSDMAIGLARMMNVRFPRNFESPYKAQSVIEYWQRWHITLTHFLTSYLYTPVAMGVMRWRMARRMGINRAAQQSLRGFAMMLAYPLFLTMTLAGIWHGAGLTFVVFGVLHGFYLCVNHAWRLFRPQSVSSGWLAVAGRCALTYLCVLIGSVFFRAPSCTAALNVLAGMAGVHGWGVDGLPHFDYGHIFHLILLYVIVWVAPSTQQIMYRYDPVLGETEPPSIRWLVWDFSAPVAAVTGAVAAIGLLALGGTTEFLYFQF